MLRIATVCNASTSHKNQADCLRYMTNDVPDCIAARWNAKASVPQNGSFPIARGQLNGEGEDQLLSPPTTEGGGNEVAHYSFHGFVLQRLFIDVQLLQLLSIAPIKVSWCPSLLQKVGND